MNEKIRKNVKDGAKLELNAKNKLGAINTLAISV